MLIGDWCDGWNVKDALVSWFVAPSRNISRKTLNSHVEPIVRSVESDRNYIWMLHEHTLEVYCSICWLALSKHRFIFFFPRHFLCYFTLDGLLHSARLLQGLNLKWSVNWIPVAPSTVASNPYILCFILGERIFCEVPYRLVIFKFLFRVTVFKRKL